MDTKNKILAVTALSADYCRTLEICRDLEVEEFVDKMLNLLPRLYLAFTDVVGESEESEEYFESYVDEDFYESIRRKVESLLGPDDTFLETFEENMKYSDTPIAASISESLADIFQPLYNFISIVKDSEGEKAEAAYTECRENFMSYWAQTLCNVLRAINWLKYKGN
ncbi:MAG: DUF5063 domain-containing protein [Muribaculaceae bacterium]|nr:DUF5063 domain-containing protein [Muribaculaceae bacterium]